MYAVRLKGSTAVFTFLAKEAFGTRTSASTLATVRDDGKDVASVVHASNSEMSLAIMSDASHWVCALRRCSNRSASS